MKMETPLEVLSRAASIVQNEENPKLLSERSGSGDSGFDEESSRRCSPLRRESPPVSPTSSNIARDRRSPKRQHSVTEKSFKKLKLDDKEEKYRVSPKAYRVHPINSPITLTTYSYHNKSPITATTVERKIKTKSEEGSPPPLISICETRKNISTLPDYDTLFPRPSVISTSPPSSTYMDYCRKGRLCTDTCCTTTPSLPSSRYPDLFKKSNISSVISRDFELPTVEDHFRKSLGDKYDISKHCQNLNERPSSVDDHFAKALGTKWYSLGYGRCASS